MASATAADNSFVATPLAHYNPDSHANVDEQVLDELVHMETFFREMMSTGLNPRPYPHRGVVTRGDCSGKRMADLYELVQHAGNILPRMYLLITV